VSGIAAALALSARSASPLTKELFAESWTAEQLADFVCEQRNATIATTNTSGQPHAAVVIASVTDDDIYFTVTPGSVLARNLAVNNRIAISVCDRVHAVMGQGRAVRVGAASGLEPLIAQLTAASRSGRFTPEGWNGDIYRVDLRRLFAN
jgi:pyridoxine/pyridoxamine 5'-phosphate oxidase